MTRRIRTPAGRYGRPPSSRRRLAARTLLVAAALVVTGLFVYLATLASTPSVRYGLLGFQRLPGGVRIRFQVDRPARSRVTCSLRSRARDGAVLGRADVAVPVTGRSRVVVSYDLHTGGGVPVTGEVTGCRSG